MPQMSPPAGRGAEPVDSGALADYYDNEATAQFRQPRDGRREALRDQMISGLAAECQVVDVGAGPGRDGRAFLDAGCRDVGVDLAVGNARLAASKGLTVVPGSLFDLSIAIGSADVVSRSDCGAAPTGSG